MAEEGSVTVAILKDIRDEVRGLRGELRDTNGRLDRTNERLDAVVREQIRTSTAVVALEKGQRELTSVVAAGFERLGARIDNLIVGPMGQQVRDHEARIQRLESQVGAR